MDLQTATEFFKWCTIITGAILLFWSLAAVVAPDFIFRQQSRWFAINRQSYDVVMFAFLAAFKILFIVFSLVPFLALWIIS